MTYAELNRRVNQAAHALADLGLKPGERLTVLSDNSARYLETYLAAAKLGASVTPLNTRLSDSELDYIVTDSEAVAIVAGDGYEARASTLLSSVPALRLGVSLDNDLEGFTGYEEALAQAPDHEPDRGRGPSEDELAVLMYTGGTTGAPKGVMLSHRNVMTAAIAAAPAMEFTKDDSTCFVLPIFHVSWWPILSLLLVGGKVVINRRQVLDEILRLIQDEKCTHMNSVPTIYGWLIEMAPVDSYDVRSLRSLTYAGSPIAVEILKRAITVFGPIFTQGYGATETAGGPITIFEAADHFAGPCSGLSFSAGLRFSEEAVTIAEAHGWGEDPALVTALATGAMALLWLGRFDEAERWLERAGRALQPDGEPATELIVHDARGLLRLAQGRFEEALSAFRAAERMQALLATKHAFVVAVRARLLQTQARMGQLAAARAALADISKAERDTSDMRIAAGVIHLAEGEPEQAVDLLGTVIEGSAPTIHRSSRAIEAQVLDSVAREQLGDQRAAEASLERALELAEPGGIVLPFILLPVQDLLESLPRRRTGHATLRQTILDVLAGSAPRPNTEAAGLLEELSEAELRVVRYLPSNLRAPEIAAELFVSTNTIRTHLRHVYAKLDAHGRAEAVARARQLGLLAPSHRQR